MTSCASGILGMLLGFCLTAWAWKSSGLEWLSWLVYLAGLVGLIAGMVAGLWPSIWFWQMVERKVLERAGIRVRDWYEEVRQSLH